MEAAVGLANVKAKVARSVGWSYAAYATEAVVGLAVLAFVLRRIGTADYGALMLALSISGLTSVFDLGLLGLLTQACVAERERGGTEAASRVVSAALRWLAAAGLAAFMVCAGIALLLPGPFRIEPALVRPAALTLLLAGAAVMLTLPATGLELAHAASGSFARISFVQISVALARAFATILVIAAGYGIVALGAVHFASAALRLLLLWTGLTKHADGLTLQLTDTDHSVLHDLWSPRRWATADNMGRQAAAASSSIILGMLASISAVATFGVAMRAPGHLVAIANRGIGVTLPYLSRQHAREQHDDLRTLFTSTMAVALAILVPVCIAGIFFAPAIIQIIGGEQYSTAVPVLRMLLIGTMVQAFSLPSYQVLYARGEIGVAARIGVAEAVASILLTFLLVPRMGALGAATAITVTHVAGTFGWFLPAAMKAAGVRPRLLVSSVVGHAREFRSGF